MSERDLFQSKFTKVAEDSPDRCQAVSKNVGQCRYRRQEGSQYCPRHGGNRGAAALKKEKLRNYHLGELMKKRVLEMSNSDDIKSLRDEIGIVRVMLEKRLNLLVDDHDVVMNTGPVMQMIQAIERLVVSCHRVEKDMGELLDRPQIMQFADEIIQSVTTHVSDKDVVFEIANDILEIVERFGETDDES
jgi:hypothetical protein